MVKNCNSNQISYSMGYRIGKETTFREIEAWLYDNFDDGFDEDGAHHVISNDSSSLKEMINDLKKHLNIK